MTDHLKNAQFHWAEGNKFALEFFKSMFLLSATLSAALIGLMATNKGAVTHLYWPIGILLTTAGLAVFALIICYFINLHYGNAEMDPQQRSTALKAHTFMYFYSAVLIGFFIWGMIALIKAAQTLP